MKQQLSLDQLNSVNGGIAENVVYELYREVVLDAENPGHGYYVIHYSNGTEKTVEF